MTIAPRLRMSTVLGASYAEGIEKNFDEPRQLRQLVAHFPFRLD
jgi:hypothetical protein